MKRQIKRNWLAAWCAVLLLLATPIWAAAQTSKASVVDDQPSESTPITLEPILVPDVGTEATFIISAIQYTEMLNATGLFQLFTLDEANESSFLAVRVRYTVLEPDPVTGHPRLLAEAQPIDPETAQALDGRRWEAIYQLTPYSVEQESGSAIPSEYADLISPIWLVDWSLALAEDLPTGPIQPGTEWSSNPVLNAEHFPLGSTPLPVAGTFSAWVQLPTGEVAAHVAETLFDEGVVEGYDLGNGIFGDVEYALMGGNDYWLQPGGFPYQAESYLWGEMSLSFDPRTADAFGFTGSFTMQFYFEKTVVPDTLGFDGTDSGEEDASASLDLEIGQVVTGALHPDGLQLGDGTPAQVYAFWGHGGDEIRIRLESNEFDAYLFLLDDHESVIASDDDSAGGTNAEIVHVLPYTGQYYIIVNSYYAGEYGEYTLGLLPADLSVMDPVLVPGVPYHGRLDRITSFQFEDGTFADFYTFYGVAGQEVTILLESEAFDAYLILFDDTDTVIEDDDSGGGSNAFIRYTLPYTGYYYVVANSYYAGEFGEYTLTLNMASDIDTGIAQLVALLEKWRLGTASDEELAAMEVFLTELLAEVQQQLPLRVENVRLLVQPPLGYGMYDVREGNRFRIGETMWIYLEPKNYGAEWDGQQYRMQLAADVYLLDPGGNVIFEQLDILEGVIHSAHHNQELFLVIDLTLSEESAPAGNYAWRIVVRDVITGDSASVEVPFELYD